MPERLNRTAELFDEKGVDYRIIGSYALSLYMNKTIEMSDIDVLVPRADIKVMPEIRESLKRDFGRSAVLGTYPSMRVVDFTDEKSSLEYRDLRVSLDTSTMKERDIYDIKTISPEDLQGLYGTIGIDRKKDRADREFLSDISDHEVDPAFGEFKRLRQERYPLYAPVRHIKEVLTKPIPKKMKLLIQDEIEKRVESRYDG